MTWTPANVDWLYADDSYALACGDCRVTMAALEPNSVDAIVCDPPYGLEFMGKEWDRLLVKDRDASFPSCRHAHGPNEYRAGIQAQEWHLQWAIEALRVAKPGAHLLAFGGTRTFHRLACAIEDAGWEIRDCLLWLYGSGFPKSLDVSKAIDKAAGAKRTELVRDKATTDPRYACDSHSEHLPVSKGWNKNSMVQPGKDCPARYEFAPATDAARQWEGWGTALKPAWEPIILARKPLEGTVAANVQKWGTGALNIDGARVDGPVTPDQLSAIGSGKGYGNSPGHGIYHGVGGEKIPPHPSGRWPANLIHDGSDEVVGMFPQADSAHIRTPAELRKVCNVESCFGTGGRPGWGYDDSGSAARFFYCAKAQKSERWRFLSCNCQTVNLCSWIGKDGEPCQKQDQNLSDRTDSMLHEQDICAETLKGDLFCNTSGFGHKQMGESQKDNACITSTEIDKTTPSEILSLSHIPNTNGSITDAGLSKVSGTNHVRFAGDSFRLMEGTFICPPKDGRFMGVVVNATSPLWLGLNKCVACGSDLRETAHPTQKPLALMSYLIQLITPPGGVVLDPFAGSGSTLRAAANLGFRSLGVELSREYCQIIIARMQQGVLPLAIGKASV